MKLRIKDNSIRVRLTQSEVALLAESGVVESRTAFGRGRQEFIYRVLGAAVAVPAADLSDGTLTVMLPQNTVSEWAATDRVGIEAEHENGTDNGLRIVVEKDFTCLTPRAGGDDVDTFPNPQTQGHCSTATNG